MKQHKPSPKEILERVLPLKLAMVKQRMSISQVAAASGVTTSMLYQMFAGEKSPSIVNYCKIAHAVGLTVDIKRNGNGRRGSV